MTFNRCASVRIGERAKRRSRDRRILLGGWLALVGCLLLIITLIAYARANHLLALKPGSGQLVQPSSRDLAATSHTARDRAELDQRTFALRRLRDKNESSDDSTEPKVTSSDVVDSYTVSDQKSPLNPVDASQDEANEKNPRKLLKKARRQAQAGSLPDALETSQQIAGLLPDSEERTQLMGKLNEAAAAAAAGQLVDFDSLIQLMQNTIAPTTWSGVGGPGSVQSFPGGVYVDTTGLLRHITEPEASTKLVPLRDKARFSESISVADPQSNLHKVSLTRLEQEVARRFAANQPLSEDIQYLAGLTEVRYLLVYPEQHDVVLVGPAEEWRMDDLGRAVGRNSGRPVLQLDDLVVILRACFSSSESHGQFGCGIYPRAERLQQVQEYLAASEAAGPIDPSRRERWLEELRDRLGLQDIEVSGVPAGSRVAHVMVEADYRMKLIGIGLEPAAVPGIPSYFELLGTPDDARLNRPLDTLRWWFTLHYESIHTTSEHDAFALRGGRVQVLSENELLTATGQRVHTGQSDPINEQFARNFTDRYPALAEHDANFADLAGIFDLAVVCGLLRGYEIPQAVGWPMDTFLDPDDYIVSLRPAARTVETVMNHRVYHGRHITAAISGGVHVNPWKVISPNNLQIPKDDYLIQTRTRGRATQSGPSGWWWD